MGRPKTLEAWIYKRTQKNQDLYDGREIRRLASRYSVSSEAVRSALRRAGWEKKRTPSGVCTVWKPHA